MPKTLDELMNEILNDEGRLADIAGADDPVARAVEVAAEAGLALSPDQIMEALADVEELPDELLVAVAGGATNSNAGDC